MDELSRRRLLARAAALAVAGMAPLPGASAIAQTRIADDPFALGVTSGEPLPDGVVLWTRLAPRPLEIGYGLGRDPVVVTWEIAEDEALTRTAARGTYVAIPEGGHSVHVEVGGLKPARDYWYRFRALGHASPVGRTRTAPAPGAAVDRLTLAYGSCQKYSAGHYTAYADLAASSPDVVLFLGDYIYEGAENGKGVRAHPAEEAADLSTYRHRYAWYKADPLLQAAHAAAPWVVVWDDHEVTNDYGDDTDRSNPDPKAFLRRRAAAYQAFFENMPLRRAQMPVGKDLTLYRSLAWGDLARIDLIDTREYRDHRTCDPVSHGKRIPADCAQRFDPARSMLGRPQEAWLQRTLKAGGARWNLLAQQSLMGGWVEDAAGAVSNDGWDGWDQTRRRILETWRDARVSNPLVLGGNEHIFFAGDLSLRPGEAPLATEFVGGSITSLGAPNAELAAGLPRNPHIRFAEGETRGYGRVEITRKAATVTFRGVENALTPGTPVRDVARFVVQDGVRGMQRA